jgi:FkbM family methyltransferase
MKAIFYPDGLFYRTAIPKIYYELYFEKVYQPALSGKRNLIILDIGANIGITVNDFIGHAKQIYAIEPESKNYEALEKNKTFNQWDNVKLIKAAIAEKDGEMELNLNPTNITTHSLITSHKHGSEKVRIITFETLFKENNIEKVDFVKLDIEGYETIVLLGEDFKKMSSKINMIEIEFHGQDLTKIIETMTSLGFKNKQIKSSAVIYLFYK